MIDAQSKKALYINDAYEAITGRSRQSLFNDPTSCEELIHPDDRARVLGKLDEATRTGHFNERFRIIWTHGEIRWVHVRGFPVRNATGKIFRLVVTALEITQQKLAEDQVAKNLESTERARAEAEALRKATLALTQDLRMDSVMEALLRSLEELIPYTCARVLVAEGGPHVLALGERQIPEPPKTSPKYRPGYPLTLVADESPFLKRMLDDRKSVLIPDTAQEMDWHTFQGHSDLHSWLSAPLIASGEYLGFLSVGHKDAHRFTREHLRRAVPNYWRSLQPRRFKTPDCSHGPISSHLSLRSDWSISERPKPRSHKHTETGKSQKINSTGFFVLAQFPSPSQP